MFLPLGTACASVIRQGSGGVLPLCKVSRCTSRFVDSGAICAVASAPRPLKTTTLSPGASRRTFSAWCDSASSSRRASGFQTAGGM